MILHQAKSRKKQNRKPLKERLRNEEWLKSLGITKNTKRKAKAFVQFVPKEISYTRPGSDDYKKCSSVDTGVSGPLTKTGIMKDYHKLSTNDREIVDHLGTCIAPLHKGHYTYISAGTDPASLGRKNEVL
jgi:hypothetical protein